ncbi:SRPBCC family protein [Streptomyces sp. LP05-1]|uniref:SRPBCC family protein n=1 Tax=Streptomyces pyxinae TaxID=2970734 RepID=A0ABT2CFP4_9ACTN|nr:SRPBCC family protein [Streptomyces sp. LP05-1]MCS0636234.1 SRPBCC family protein [Streptomyces sp. LP05-1]
MDWCHYRFHAVWSLPAAPDAVFRVLARPDDYPHWWPQVREATRLGEHSGTLRIRSVLPYDLRITATERRLDPDARVLEAELDGDLTGWLSWRVVPDGAGTGAARAVYDQEVEVRLPLLRRLAVPGRPFFRANHALMMRSGRKGLAALLAGG